MNSQRLQPLKGRVGQLGHYWFLTFEHAPDLHALTESCQQKVDTTYFEPTRADGLHLTLDRIAHEGAPTPEQLASFEGLATQAAAAVEQIAATNGKVEVTATEAVLVALKRREFSYSWRIVARVLLDGEVENKPSSSRRSSGRVSAAIMLSASAACPSVAGSAG
ncbi:hypothetical protein [Nocardia sp. CNY236]|uniref:hypothetical protein n=1 Tax=Nocardia sp. CNY236 TaxID=1169152 RepID=UPI000491399B|nr:hypothetical protein [Nocardia sp. CNY236]